MLLHLKTNINKTKPSAFLHDSPTFCAEPWLCPTDLLTAYPQHSLQLSPASAEHFPETASSPPLIQLLSKPYLFHLDHFSCTTQLHAASPLWPLVFADGSEWVSHSDTEPTVQCPEQLYWDSLCWGCWVAKSCHYNLFHVMDGHGREEAWTPLCWSLAELDSTVFFPSWSYRADSERLLPNSREWKLVARHLERSIWFPERPFGRLEEIYLGFPLRFSFWII